MKAENVFEARVSRRDLFKAGKLAAGAAAIAAVASSTPGLGAVAAAAAVPTQKWPWPYVKLDPLKTADIAYAEWYRVFCGAAIVKAVFGQLAEKVGEPYRSFPIDAFMFLEGGISGWGTICGANAGANIVTNLVLGPRIAGSEDGPMMGSELLQYYSSTAMPTYVPKEPVVKAEIARTVAESPLCHVSVGKWMKAAGKPLGSPERRDRCARLTASMAFQTVTLLNAWKDGTYRTTGTTPANAYGIQAQHDCAECHAREVPTPPAPGT